MKTVLVTGGSGFIAGWTVVELLKRGYLVRTTVRSAAKVALLRTQISDQLRAQPDGDTRLTFFVADLNNDAGWDDAVAGCDYVIHVAAPVGVDAPRDPEVLIAPTRNGALRVLRAACQAKVRRVVMTSAIEACRPAMNSADGIFDESLWTDTSDAMLGPYRLAKTLAERAAWDFMSGQSGPTTLTTILPAAVLGPVFSAHYSHSLNLMQRMLSGSLPRLPQLGFCVVDVRDVVDLHISAMLAPEAAGERYIAASEWMWLAEIAGVLRSNLGNSAQKVPTKAMADFLFRTVALFNRPMQFVTPLLGRKHVFTSDKAKRMLDWNPRPAATTIVDSAQCAIALGVV
ncbi:NAD-dependent epimerase/dehydratase family protein [Undibacterium sp. TC4M20W]|uniref:NAD-dependent epimerase/dehydratase family protein n=1 Tax=unclassified Undibacterium TaxID=2630295 RepID=UPI003BF298BA